MEVANEVIREYVKLKLFFISGVFNYFSRTYEDTRFLMIKMCPHISNVIHANEHT